MLLSYIDKYQLQPLTHHKHSNLLLGHVMQFKSSVILISVNDSLIGI